MLPAIVRLGDDDADPVARQQLEEFAAVVTDDLSAVPALQVDYGEAHVLLQQAHHVAEVGHGGRHSVGVALDEDLVAGRVVVGRVDVDVVLSHHLLDVEPARFEDQHVQVTGNDHRLFDQRNSNRLHVHRHAQWHLRVLKGIQTRDQEHAGRQLVVPCRRRCDVEHRRWALWDANHVH